MKSIYVLFLLLIVSGLVKSQDSYDICIYGGTSAGVIAAYTAKKAGKSVILIEPGRHLGGLSSGGLGQTDIGNKFAITGLARDFYRRLGKYYGKFEQWTFEPHVAENLFKFYISSTKIPVLYEHRITDADKQGNKIQSIALEYLKDKKWQSGKKIEAKEFIDCSYEGDLMAKANVSYIVGRESNDTYDETWNGVQSLDKHQFPAGINPYRIAGDSSSGLLWGISKNTLAPAGSGDHALQAYNFRLCLSKDPKNKIPISRPIDYDATKYELLLRQIAIEKPNHINWGVMHIADMPNKKTDINNKGGFSTDMIGANHHYPEADYATRSQIIKEHESYIKGFLYFVGNDARMPKHLKAQMNEYGYPKDEYRDNQNFSHQIYVREARRLIGEYIMTQQNCEGKRTVHDGIGLAAYTMDSHNCQRLLVKNESTGKLEVRNEGDVQVGGFDPYPISYRSLVPKATEAINLLVPVCLSASHIAYGSIRMEPVFMVLGQAASVAATMAIDSNTSVQSIDVSVLQKKLKFNPLMDGSTPEILIDKDITPEAITFKGSWLSSKKGGKYANSLDYTDLIEKAAASFKVTIEKSGLYDFYYFNPALEGGGVNPGDENWKGKSSNTNITIINGNQRTVKVLSTHKQVNEWILIGRYSLNKNATNVIEINNQGADGAVVADAVICLPVRK